MMELCALCMSKNKKLNLPIRRVVSEVTYGRDFCYRYTYKTV